MSCASDLGVKLPRRSEPVYTTLYSRRPVISLPPPTRTCSLIANYVESWAGLRGCVCLTEGIKGYKSLLLLSASAQTKIAVQRTSF